MCKHCWDDTESVHHKDWIRGYEEINGFDKEVNYKPKKKSKKAVKRYPGCPGNNKGPHVFVWTSEFRRKNTLFYKHFGFHKYEDKICIGCGHVDRRRRTEEYVKRNDRALAKLPPSRYRSSSWWSFEDQDEEYRAKRRAYVSRNGWNFEYFGD